MSCPDCGHDLMEHGPTGCTHTWRRVPDDLAAGYETCACRVDRHEAFAERDDPVVLMSEKRAMSAKARNDAYGARDVVEILDALALNYTPTGVGVWLFGRHASLDGRRPIDVLREGDVDAVRASVPDPGMIAT